MHLENLSLVHFKNYRESMVRFSKAVNCLVGDNGSGKTNLLDAIYYLSMTKSAFNVIDQQNILHGEDYFTIAGNFHTEKKKTSVRCSFARGDKKKISNDKIPLEKASDHIGAFPVIMIAPNDHEIILEGSDTRRKFFDSLLSQIDKSYLANLIEYNQALKRRNHLLKNMAVGGIRDQDQIEPYDHMLLNKGKSIRDKRSTFCREFVPSLMEYYANISGQREQVTLDYQSVFNDEDYFAQFKNALSKDFALERTTVGIHRDDFIFKINDYPLKKFGSQGQQKSFLISLKLAQFEALRHHKNFKPIVLLDDIFDKLDDHRIHKLVKMIEQGDFGQIFITDARPERTQNFLDKIDLEVKVFTVSHGTVTGA